MRKNVRMQLLAKYQLLQLHDDPAYYFSLLETSHGAHSFGMGFVSIIDYFIELKHNFRCMWGLYNFG